MVTQLRPLTSSLNCTIWGGATCSPLPMSCSFSSSTCSPTGLAPFHRLSTLLSRRAWSMPGSATLDSQLSMVLISSQKPVSAPVAAAVPPSTMAAVTGRSMASSAKASAGGGGVDELLRLDIVLGATAGGSCRDGVAAGGEQQAF
jgi:hypothetical protein